MSACDGITFGIGAAGEETVIQLNGRDAE